MEDTSSSFYGSSPGYRNVSVASFSPSINSMSDSELQSILAFDLRPRSFAFAVFEGRRDLLDWGKRSFRGGVNAVRVPLGPKVARLFDQYFPEVVVFKRPKTEKLQATVNEIKSQANAQRIPVRPLSEKILARAFVGANENKQQIASRITEQFPELLSILPPKRKLWQSEDYRMSIFDAAAVGIAYLHARRGH